MIGRRQAIQAIGLGALAAPAAAREITQNTLAGPRAYGEASTGIGQAISPGLPPWERARRAFADKETLAAIRASLFEQNKIITVLDTDLATKRSFSLAAKIAFQRQRNVEAEMQRMTLDHYSGHAWGIVQKFLGAGSR